MNKPNFLCVGAPKAGTTSLHNYLSDHPEIYMAPKKEPRFFCSEYYKNLNKNDPRWKQSFSTVTWNQQEYFSLYDDVTDELAVGESSVQYLYLHALAIPEVKKCIGDPKILIVLRSPVDRCISSYTRALRDGFELETLIQSMKNEEFKKKENWSLGHFHVSLGFYYDSVKAYVDNFTNVKIIIYDDYKTDPVGVIQDIFDFLCVSRDFIPSQKTKYNVSGLPVSRILHNMLIKKFILRSAFVSILRFFLSEMQIRKMKERIMALNISNSRVSIPTNDLAYLKSLFKDDVEKLGHLLNRDLTHWLE